MTLEQAQMILDTRGCQINPWDSWQVQWAKFCVEHYEELLARAAWYPDAELKQEIIKERHKRFMGIVIADLMAQR